MIVIVNYTSRDELRGSNLYPLICSSRSVINNCKRRHNSLIKQRIPFIPASTKNWNRSISAAVVYTPTISRTHIHYCVECKRSERRAANLSPWWRPSTEVAKPSSRIGLFAAVHSPAPQYRLDDWPRHVRAIAHLPLWISLQQPLTRIDNDVWP